MEFEWDENKNLENTKNHDGISFKTAVKAFEDDLAIHLKMRNTAMKTKRDSV